MIRIALIAAILATPALAVPPPPAGWENGRSIELHGSERLVRHPFAYGNCVV